MICPVCGKEGRVVPHPKCASRAGTGGRAGTQARPREELPPAKGIPLGDAIARLPQHVKDDILRRINDRPRAQR